MVFIQSNDVVAVVGSCRLLCKRQQTKSARARTQQFANRAVIMFYGITDRPWRVPAFIRSTEISDKHIFIQQMLKIYLFIFRLRLFLLDFGFAARI